jgi:hypothetical protein
MGRELPGFILAYEDLATAEMLEKASVWYAKAAKIPVCKPALRRGRSYRLSEFRRFQKFGGEAYDLILSLDIITRCLGVFTAYSAICLIDQTSRMEKDANSSIEKTTTDYIKAIMSLSSYLFEMTASALRLVLSGNDVAARLLCRSALEASDYFLAIQDDAVLGSGPVKSIAGSGFR